MEQKRSSSLHLLPLFFNNRFSFHSLISCFLVFFLSFHGGVQGASAYTNYTVGDSLGWYDNLLKPKVNYQKWVAGKNFSLGDFLIFNTDKNHSVVQTNNVTTYRRCDSDNDDTTDWSAGEPEFNSDPVELAVPLVKEGMTYFFSGYYEGEQCRHGQHFKITVAHGQGLPDSLKIPPPDSPAPASPDDVPDTVIPSNFDNPTGTGDIKPTSAAGKTLPVFLGGRCGLGSILIGFLVVFG